MVWTGFGQTPAMGRFRLVCVGGQASQQGNAEGEISELRA